MTLTNQNARLKSSMRVCRKRVANMSFKENWKYQQNKMSVKIKRIEETESFIVEFEREESSKWNVRSPSYKNRDEKKAVLYG